jgi:beta-N-acetylhexosaminidase
MRSLSRTLKFVTLSSFVFLMNANASVQATADLELSLETVPEAQPLALSPDDQKIFAKMTLTQKVGQLFLIGFMGKQVDEGLSEMIHKVRPGGLILFSRNIHSAPQVVSLVSEAQKAAVKVSGVPLLVGVDQEGGNVIRIKTSLPLPSALAFGEAGEKKLVEEAGMATGQLLKILGINMNFAPVLDVGDPTKPNFIGTRTYGSEARLVSQMGAGFSFGLDQGGVLPTGKHFPGHGGIDEDSHKGTPTKNVTMQELEASDLVPFVEMKKQFGDRWAVMLGHVAYPKIDPTGMPATFSKPIVTGILREKIGFNGLIVTDDIEMGGAFAIKDVRERALRAVEAGADMVMIAWNKRLQRDLALALQKAVESGRIPTARLDESVKRILIAKRNVAQIRTTPPTNIELARALRNPKFTEVAERAMAIRFERPAQKQEQDFKEYATGKPLLVFSSNQRFSENFKRALPNRPLKFYPLDPERPDLIDRAMRANPRSAGVFYVSGQQAAKVINKISKDVSRRMLVVSVETQGALRNAAQFGYFADVYYRHPALGKMIADHYFNDSRQPAKERTSQSGKAVTTIPIPAKLELEEAPTPPAPEPEL